MKVFISYSNRNRDLVETLAKDLDSALGMISSTPNEVWFDERLVGGQDWWNTILSHLLNCDIFVFALSPYSIKSDACARELQYATDLHKQLLPVWITGELSAMDLPELLQSHQWINYSQQDKAAFQALLTAVRQLPAAEPLPDPLPPPPAVPLSPLAEISHQLSADKIDRDRQNEILARLREFLEQPEASKDAYQLLLRLKQHPDLRRSVAEDIDDLIHDHPEFVQSSAPAAAATPAPQRQAAAVPVTNDPFAEPQPLSQPSISKPVTVSPPAKSGFGRWFGLNGRTIGLVIGIIGGFVEGQSSGNCGYDIYNNWVCSSTFSVETFVTYIIIWTLLGWGGDILWRRFVKKNNTSTS